MLLLRYCFISCPILCIKLNLLILLLEVFFELLDLFLMLIFQSRYFLLRFFINVEIFIDILTFIKFLDQLEFFLFQLFNFLFEIINLIPLLVKLFITFLPLTSLHII